MSTVPTRYPAATSVDASTRTGSNSPDTQAAAGTSTSACATCVRLFARSRRDPGRAPRNTMSDVGMTTARVANRAGKAMVSSRPSMANAVPYTASGAR